MKKDILPIFGWKSMLICEQKTSETWYYYSYFRIFSVRVFLINYSNSKFKTAVALGEIRVLFKERDFWSYK